MNTFSAAKKNYFLKQKSISDCIKRRSTHIATHFATGFAIHFGHAHTLYYHYSFFYSTMFLGCSVLFSLLFYSLCNRFVNFSYFSVTLRLIFHLGIIKLSIKYRLPGVQDTNIYLKNMHMNITVYYKQILKRVTTKINVTNTLFYFMLVCVLSAHYMKPKFPFKTGPFKTLTW